MYKLSLLFKETATEPNLMERWSQEFVPLAEQLPGLKLILVSHFDGGPAGPSEWRLQHDLIFESKDELMAAMQSEAGVSAGQALVRITRNAPEAVLMLFAEHMEDKPHPTLPMDPRSTLS